MADYYPLMVRLDGKSCLVVGGGTVAERKVSGLLQAGADVTVVSPRLTAELARMAAEGSIKALTREYLEEDLDGVFLVFAAAGSRETNKLAASAAKRRGVLCNVADEAGDGDVVTSATVRRGSLLIAVTTGGASPAMAARIGRELAARYGEPYAAYTACLRLLRERLPVLEPDIAIRRELLKLAAAEMDTEGSWARSAVRGLLEEATVLEDWINRLRSRLTGGGNQ